MGVGVDAHWQQAWWWLKSRRHDHPADSDIWDLWWRTITRPQTLAQLYERVTSGGYMLKPLRLLMRRDGSGVPVWTAEDALVLKWVALHLQALLPLHPACTHTKGYGGCAGATCRAESALDGGTYRFLYRTDIRGFYRHIRREDILVLLATHVGDAVLRDLADQAVSGNIEDGGTFFTANGLVRGSSLSPLLGSALLYEMDRELAQRDVFYVRYMDDLLLMTRTRWGLRRARSLMMAHLTAHGFSIACDKTQVGSLSGVSFTWLGYRYDTGPRSGQYTRTKLPVHRHDR